MLSNKLVVEVVVFGIIITLFTGFYGVPQSCQGRNPCLLWGEVDRGFPLVWLKENNPMQPISTTGLIIDFLIWFLISGILLIMIKKFVRKRHQT